MRYRNIIITTGFLVIINPFLGIPDTWKITASVLIGLSIIILAYISKPVNKN